MSGMKLNRFIIDDLILQVSHEECSDPSWHRDSDIFIESHSSDKNTLSTIQINSDSQIYIFWESHSFAKALDILYVPETSVLFIGCGALSARISIKDKKLIDIEHVHLFWELTRYKAFVLATGELDCYLYDLFGNRVARAAVDPPYETVFLEDAIKFKSIVHGTTWLKFPESA